MPAGPLPEAGYDCHSISVVGWSHLRSVLWSSTGRLPGDRPLGPTSELRPGLASLRPRRAPVLLHSFWEKFPNRSGEFFKERRGERSQGRPLAPRPPPGSEGGSAAAGLPHRGPLSFPYTVWHWCPPNHGSFSPPRGEGGDSQCLHELRGARPARAARDGAPPSACGAPRSTPTRW